MASAPSGLAKHPSRQAHARSVSEPCTSTLKLMYNFQDYPNSLHARAFVLDWATPA